MRIEEFKIDLLTPCFCRGAYPNDRAEIRVSSIRGQLRWWLRALGTNRELESQVFGSAGNKEAENRSSSVGLQLRNAVLEARRELILPHSKKFRAPALAANGTFTIQVASRPGQPERLFELAKLAVRTWLLLGGLGFRSNRGAGSVWPADGPQSIDSMRHELSKLRETALKLDLEISVGPLWQALMDVLKTPFDTPEEARRVCSDTIMDGTGKLGYAGSQGRQSSPLKFKVIRLANESKPYWILRVGFPGPDDHRAGDGLKLLTSKPIGGEGIPLA
ncbi:MAG: type III-B CRISPR module RAMP protein Cmr1 [Acidobacteria bacterium]|nr:type III-B CRISPR module RAMP protein Cmr1 [Acidobacteriota bacterium]